MSIENQKSQIWNFYRKNKPIGHMSEAWFAGFDAGFEYKKNAIDSFNLWIENPNQAWYFETFNDGYQFGKYYQIYTKTKTAPLKLIVFFEKINN